ncbi:MAG: mechanosensitive ion channel family protein [bacterium]
MNALIDRLKLIDLGANTAYDFLLAAGIFVAVLVGLKLVQIIVLVRLRQLAERTQTRFDDAVIEVFENIRPPFYGLAALYLATLVLTLPGWIQTVVNLAFGIAVAIQVAVAVGRLIDRVVEIRSAADEENAGGTKLHSVFRTFGRLAKAAVWVVAALTLLANFGVNVTSLLAGLGIGGIAVALALQNVLGDLFSSVAIMIDRPFSVGDLITTGEHTGTVERIGLKSTRIRTTLGEELVMSNRELTDARISNFGRMERRRALFRFGLTYGLSVEKLRQVPKTIEKIVSSGQNSKFARCHFVGYSDSSLDFETAFHVETGDYDAYLDELQRVNLGIYEAFARDGIEFAFPTRTVILEK